MQNAGGSGISRAELAGGRKACQAPCVSARPPPANLHACLELFPHPFSGMPNAHCCLSRSGFETRLTHRSVVFADKALASILAPRSPMALPLISSFKRWLPLPKLSRRMPIPDFRRESATDRDSTGWKKIGEEGQCLMAGGLRGASHGVLGSYTSPSLLVRGGFSNLPLWEMKVDSLHHQPLTEASGRSPLAGGESRRRRNCDTSLWIKVWCDSDPSTLPAGRRQCLLGPAMISEGCSHL